MPWSRRCWIWRGKGDVIPKNLILTWLACLALLSAPTAAQEEGDYEWIADTVRSDLPLYTFAWEDVWPRGFSHGEGKDYQFGCESRVALGDWRLTPNPDDPDGEPLWWRITNHGFFHCGTHMRDADEREELSEAGEGNSQPGLIARIGTARHAGQRWELWVFQKGFLPGSEYTLLARSAETDELIKRFTLLQRRCPHRNVREASDMDSWRTRYCAINTRGELLALAKRMLREPSLGELEYVGLAKGDE